MHVASLALCQELKALSGWTDTYFQWRTHPSGEAYVVGHVPDADPLKDETPAYDLGYLYRRLPGEVLDADNVSYGLTLHKLGANESHVNYWWFDDIFYREIERSTTPEDAAARIAIELFKQGVLARGGDE